MSKNIGLRSALFVDLKCVNDVAMVSDDGEMLYPKRVEDGEYLCTYASLDDDTVPRGPYRYICLITDAYKEVSTVSIEDICKIIEANDFMVIPNSLMYDDDRDIISFCFQINDYHMNRNEALSEELRLIDDVVCAFYFCIVNCSGNLLAMEPDCFLDFDLNGGDNDMIFKLKQDFASWFISKSSEFEDISEEKKFISSLLDDDHEQILFNNNRIIVSSNSNIDEKERLEKCRETGERYIISDDQFISISFKYGRRIIHYLNSNAGDDYSMFTESIAEELLNK